MKLCDKKMAARLGLDPKLPPLERGDRWVIIGTIVIVALCFLGLLVLVAVGP